MTITLELSEREESELRQRAEAFGIRPEALARAAVVDLLGQSDAAFAAAAERVFRKNAELYRRLAR